MSAPTRLTIVDDDPMVRAGLVMMVGGDSGITVVAEAADGEQALTVVPDSRAEALTTFDTDDMVLSALRRGAAWFMLKDTPPARLVEAVRTVASGRLFTKLGVGNRVQLAILVHDAAE